jgi:predicted membrane protein
MCIICLLHLQAMFNFEMDLSSYFTCFHVLKLLLFIAALITYDIYLSYMFVLFRIKIFNIFKYDGSMSLISLKLQQSRKPIRIMASSSDVIKPEVFDGASFKCWQIKTHMWLTDLKLLWVVTSTVPEAASDFPV